MNTALNSADNSLKGGNVLNSLDIPKEKQSLNLLRKLNAHEAISKCNLRQENPKQFQKVVNSALLQSDFIHVLKDQIRHQEAINNQNDDEDIENKEFKKVDFGELSNMDKIETSEQEFEIRTDVDPNGHKLLINYIEQNHISPKKY